MGKRQPDGPLSIAERNKLITDTLEKHPHPTRLFIKAWPGIYKMARRFAFNDEEINSMCLMAMVKSARTFDPKGGSNFPTYSARGMANEVSCECRKLSRNKEYLQPAETRLSELAATIIEDDRPTHRDIEEIETVKTISDLIDKNIPLQAHRTLLKLRWGVGCPQHTYKEAGDAVGVSPVRARQIERSAEKGGRVKIAIQLAGVC